MKQEEYTLMIKKILEKHYDLKEYPPFFPFPLLCYGHFYQKNEKYLGSKKLNIWRLEHEDHLFVRHVPVLQQADLEETATVLKEGIKQLVKPHAEHMKTTLTGVFLTTTPLSPAVKNSIEKFKYGKPFMFYLHGWCDLRFIVLDLSSRQVICSSAGREVKKFYEHLLEQIP